MRIVSLRDPARPRLRRALGAVLCAVLMTTTSRADEPPRPPTGEVRIASGRIVDYTIHFNRNSLSDSLRVGDGLIALTTSGALLRFELPAVKLVKERINAEVATCLGRGEGETVLAGLADGRVCRVDPATLELIDLAKLPSAPHWIGWGKAVGTRPAGLVVETRQSKPMDRDGDHWDQPYSVVKDLVTGKSFSLEEEATTFLLDHAGRLWLGGDKGEWGGWVTRVDLLSGSLSKVKSPPSRLPGGKAYWEGVYGFVELGDGQVWAFGGTSHMGFNTGFITRIVGTRPRPLFDSMSPLGQRREPDFIGPKRPITQIVEEEDGLLVFSFSDVFRVDKTLSSWKQGATLDVKYRWGRPDAVGVYPSVCAVNPPRRSGEPYMIATAVDGYVLLKGEKATPHSLPGQLGASYVARAENTAEGTFYFEGDDRFPVWRLGEKGWEVASLAPPVEPDPASVVATSEAKKKSWYETRVLVGVGGKIFTVSATSFGSGTRTTARRVGGKSERIGRETSSLDPSSSFITSDGTLWNAFRGNLKRFVEGQWETKAPLPKEKYPFRLKSLNTNGPPWLLLDRGYDLWRLEHGPKSENPRLAPVVIQEGGKALLVFDAIPWTNGALLATDAGLRVYAIAAAKLSRADFPEPVHPATALARDGLGRLWLGGADGLWMAEPGGKTAESFDRVPWIGRNEVVALSPDPRCDDGVIAALGSRGVAFVRARKKP